MHLLLQKMKMRISTDKYSLDIFLLLIWSIVFIPIIHFDINPLLQIFLGFPIIFFIPGYLSLLILYPSKKINKGIDNVERFAFSFALSLAIIPILGLILNYTPWGLNLYSILIILELFIFITSIIALYRRNKIPQKNRFKISMNFSLNIKGDIFDKILTIILVISIISFLTIFYYVITSPRESEPFTEFYIVNSDGIINKFPTKLGYSEEASIKIGIINHEHSTKKYTLEIWLVNQSISYDEFTNTNKTDINHMWFKSKTVVQLNHIPSDINQPWEPQWEKEYKFSINREGEYRWYFLLFKNDTQEYQIDYDYKDIATEKLEDAYSITNFPIYVPFSPWISNIQATPNSTLQNNSVKLSCSVSDADGVNNVSLYILYPDNVYHKQNINRSEDNNYQYAQIYKIAGNYQYYFQADDLKGNLAKTNIYQFNITDIPIISNISATPITTSKNSNINISCFIYDADGLENVSLIILYPDENIENISIINNKTGNNYYYLQRYNITGIYSYYIWVKDLSGYTNFSAVKEFIIT